MYSSLSPPSRTSPPLTPPPTTGEQEDERPSPALSDDASLLDVSFAYEQNAQGQYVRLSKPPTKTYAPPTPDDSPANKPPSPMPAKLPAAPLTRSESLPASSFEAGAAGRGFQRVSSGPVNTMQTPASSSSGLRSSLVPPSTGGTRKLGGGARRVKLEEYQEADALLRSQPQAAEEKENQRSLSSVHSLGRPMKSMRTARGPSRKVGIEKILEEHPYEDVESAPEQFPHQSIRPRRSASLSEAAGINGYDFENGNPGASYQPQYSRPGTSLGIASRGARRVTMEERYRQEREIALDEAYARREAEELAETERRAYLSSTAPRQSPSPTHISSAAHLRPVYAHQRKDSDTLRNVTAGTPTSPTAVDNIIRGSPPTRSSAYALSTPGLTANGMSVGATSARHRRSPTAPEPPTTSDDIGPVASGIHIGKTWAAGDGRERRREEAPAEPVAQARSTSAMPPPSMNAPAPAKQAAHQHHVQTVSAAPDVRSRNIVVNKKSYARLDMIGKGGSSRVYRVMNGSNEIYAIKRVSLDKTDAETLNGYKNEIALLKRLDGNEGIIRLIDSEVKEGPGGSKGHLLLVMECGEIDLARLLQEQQKKPLKLAWVSCYWEQMLQAVHVIHEEKIVHSDLKPANFVLVRGQLKLIDFGIANAIANDTTNIQRDHQIGTVNYMSPEAIELPDGMRRLKVGRPSDVWSLGCILYQMVYGHPPFQHLSVYQKMKAIPDGTYMIDFPEYSTPGGTRAANGSSTPPKHLEHQRVRIPRNVIATIKTCLARNPKERATIPELLAMDWLGMQDPEPQPPMLRDDETIISPYFMKQLLEYGIRLGQEGKEMSEEELKTSSERLVQELKAVQTAPP